MMRRVVSKTLSDQATARRTNNTVRRTGQGAGAGQGAQADGRLRESLASAAAQLTDAHLRALDCLPETRGRRRPSARAVALAMVHPDPVAAPANFAKTLRRARRESAGARPRALHACLPKAGEETHHARFRAYAPAVAVLQ